MKRGKSLQPFEIRVIKIDRTAILNLIGEILGKISHEKFCLPYDHYSTNKICSDWYFDEVECEIVLLANDSSFETNKEAALSCIRALSIKAIDSLISNPNGKKCYYSLQAADFANGNSPPISVKRVAHKIYNAWISLLSSQSSHVHVLRKNEVRVIRLSQHAIHELLWEHFMETGDEVMDMPEEESNDIQTIYYMYIADNLEELTLYAMNFSEASDEAFKRVRLYCDQNLQFTTDSYSKKSEESCNYVSITLSQL